LISADQTRAVTAIGQDAHCLGGGEFVTLAPMKVHKRRLVLDPTWNQPSVPATTPASADDLESVARALCQELRLRALIAAVTRRRSDVG
jgi:hypothetical protein